jgi:hypothetical protein
MNLIHNQIGEILVEVLAKVQWTSANWRNSRGSIGENLIGEIRNPRFATVLCAPIINKLLIQSLSKRCDKHIF